MNKPFITALLLILLSGCIRAPTVQFFVLEPLSQSASSVVESSKQRTIGIGPVTVPSLLEHKQIITRSSNNTVQIAEFQQWASPLQDELLQAVSRNLSTLQPNNIVHTYPWSIHGTVDLQVIIDIIRFDTIPGESANLEANWTIKDENSHNILKNGHSLINHSLSDSSYPATVRALSRILGEFSRELSLELRKTENHS